MKTIINISLMLLIISGIAMILTGKADKQKEIIAAISCITIGTLLFILINKTTSNLVNKR